MSEKNLFGGHEAKKVAIAVLKEEKRELSATLMKALPALQRGQHAIRILTAVVAKYGVGDPPELRVPFGPDDPTTPEDDVEYHLDKERMELVVRFVKYPNEVP